MTKDLVHAVLTCFCSTDACRSEIREPMMLNGSVYATNGRVAVRFSHQIGFDYPTIGKQIGLCERIDAYLRGDGRYDSVVFSNNSLLAASMLATADALQAAGFEPDEEGCYYWREDVEAHALVQIGGRQFRAAYIKQIIDVLMVFDWVAAECRMYKDHLIFIAEDIAFAVMAVRDVSDHPDGYAIVDGSTCKFIHHASEWVA